MADGDSDDPNTDPYNRQAFRDEAGNEVAMPWFQNKGPFGEIKVSDDCGCQKSGATGDQQDATRYALRLHGAQFTWKFRCNNQPSFALCQKINPEKTECESRCIPDGDCCEWDGSSCRRPGGDGDCDIA